MSCCVRSRVIKITPQNFIGRVLAQWLQRYGWILIIPMGICGAMAVFRWEWIIVGFMILLPAYPMILGMMYFVHGTRPENLKFILPMQVCIDDEHIRLEFENGGSEIIEYNNIKGVSVHGKETVINLIEPKYASIVVRDNQWDTENPSKAKQAIIDIFIKNGMNFV